MTNRSPHRLLVELGVEAAHHLLSYASAWAYLASGRMGDSQLGFERRRLAAAEKGASGVLARAPGSLFPSATKSALSSAGGAGGHSHSALVSAARWPAWILSKEGGPAVADNSLFLELRRASTSEGFGAPPWDRVEPLVGTAEAAADRWFDIRGLSAHERLDILARLKEPFHARA